MDRGAWWAASMGSQSVRHDRVTKHTHTHTHTQVQEGSLKSEVGLATLAIHVFFFLNNFMHYLFLIRM